MGKTGDINEIGNNAVAITGGKVLGDIIVHCGLDEEAVNTSLDKQAKQLTQELKAQGHVITAEVERKLRDIVESKFVEFACDIRAEQVDSEERVKKAIQKNFKELQNGSVVLLKNFSAALNEKLAEGNKLLQSISELQNKAAYYAEKCYNALYSRLDGIRERVDHINDREVRKEQENISFLQKQLEYGHSALQSAEFDRAKKHFEAVTMSNLGEPNLALVANAYFGIALAEWQIQLIWDDVKNSEQFIIYKYDINLSDKHGSYREAIKNATSEQADLFRKFVAKLYRAKEKLCDYRDKELSYDCFICTKVTADKDGAKTDDCKWIEKTKLYEALKESKPFYSEVNCKEYALEQGTLEYESLIYYALSRARVMLLVCSESKYLETPWVANEINRFRQFCKKRGENPLERIIVVHKDTAVELPSDLDERYQGWNRNKTDVETIVKVVNTAVAKASGYVESGWRYCPQCEKKYSLDIEECSSNKCPAYPVRTRLVEAWDWAEIRYRRQREELERKIEELERERNVTSKPESIASPKPTEAVKFCVSCGTENPQRAKICMECGGTVFAKTREAVAEETRKVDEQRKAEETATLLSTAKQGTKQGNANEVISPIEPQHKSGLKPMSKKCPNCGGAIACNEESMLAECRYCHSQFALESFFPESYVHELIEKHQAKKPLSHSGGKEQVHTTQPAHDESTSKVIRYENGDEYEGEWKDGNRNGHGVCRYTNGNEYDGEWKDGKFNGHGIYRWADGGVYNGEWKDGNRNGQGIRRYANGNEYEGEWKDGKQNGHGVYHFASGNVYEGEFRDGNFNGQGIKHFTDGSVYEGEFKDDKFNGHGIFRWADGGVYDGDEYEGEFKDDKRNGHGVYRYANGNEYEGEWKDGKQNGHGVYHFASGNVYEGEFKDNKFNGHGVFRWADGGVYEGEWKDGNFNGHGIRRYANGDEYDGEWKDDNRNGHGVYRWADGGVYDGEFKDNKRNGHGVYHFASGTVYEGEFKDNKFNGHGVYHFANGNVYEGEFKDDKFSGHGVYRYADGSEYDGEFKDDKKNGHGVLRFADGGVYEGEFKDDKRNGHGVYRYANGNVYEGEFKDNKFNGHGVYRWADGGVYEGEFKDGNFNGHGIRRYANGNEYEGEWKDDKKNGHGVLRFANGDVSEGEWMDGNFNGHGVYHFASGNVYEGEFKDGKFNGHGVYRWADGDVYEGEFKDDKFNGHGVYRYANGNVYEGVWKDDKLEVLQKKWKEGKVKGSQKRMLRKKI